SQGRCPASVRPWQRSRRSQGNPHERPGAPQAHRGDRPPRGDGVCGLLPRAGRPMTRRVEAEELLAFIGESTRPQTRVRDVSILYSAAARPESVIMTKRTFESLPERTAALLHAIIRWEPLDMWNASFGWHAARFIARIDGADLVVSDLDRM